MSDEKEPVHYQVSITSGQAGAFFLALLLSLGLAFFLGMRTGAAAKKGPEPAARLAAASDIPVPRENADGESPSTSGPAGTMEEPPLGVPESPPKKTGADARTDAEKPEPTVPPEKPTATPRPEPTAVPREAEPEAATAAGPWYVQVVATQNAATADGLAKKLKAAGFLADVSPITPPGKPQLFRVRVGPFPDRAQAEQAAGKVQEAEKLETRPILMPAGK